MFAFSDDQIRVARNILAIARSYRAFGNIPPLVHLAVTKQESGWSETNPGDNDNSFGPYQLYLPAHPGITQRIATDPGFDYAFWEIHTRWATSWTPYADIWGVASASDRGSILERFSPAAQGSIAWTAGLGIQRYAEALAMLEVLS